MSYLLRETGDAVKVSSTFSFYLLLFARFFLFGWMSAHFSLGHLYFTDIAVF